MKLLIKILLFVFHALVTNVTVISATPTSPHIQEATTFLSFNGETQKTVVRIIENDLVNCCENEQNLVDYRNWGESLNTSAIIKVNIVSTPYPIIKYP